jgi:hypothetical protein
VLEGGIAPIGQVGSPSRGCLRIGDLDFESLRGQEPGEPVPHPTRAADHQRAAARAAAPCHDPLAFLSGQRGFDQQGHERGGQVRVQTLSDRGFACAFQYALLLGKIPQRASVLVLELPDRPGQGLAPRDQAHDVTIDFGECDPSLLDGHQSSLVLCSRLPLKRQIVL